MAAPPGKFIALYSIKELKDTILVSAELVAF